MRRRAILFVVIFLAVTAVGLSAQKSKPTKPAPPPTASPLVLGADLNIVAREISPVSQIRAWQEASDGNFSVSWTQGGLDTGYLTLALGDIDGDGKNELAAPACYTASDGTCWTYIDVFKQDYAGVYYSGRNDAGGALPIGLTRPELKAADLDGDGRDELVLRTASNVSVYSFNGGVWHAITYSLQTFGEDEYGTGPTYGGRSLAIANLDDDPELEIVTAITYPTSTNTDGRLDRSVLLVFDYASDHIGLVGSVVLSEALDPASFCVNYNEGLAVADLDGDGVNSIFVGGWTNDSTATSYYKRVLSVAVSTAGVPTSVTAPGDYGWSTRLGPKIFTGSLGTGDALAVTKFDDPTLVEVWRGGTAEQFRAMGEPARAHIAGGRIVVGGLMPAVKISRKSTLKKGIFYQVLDENLNQTWSYGLRDDSEFWTFIVGPGMK